MLLSKHKSIVKSNVLVTLYIFSPSTFIFSRAVKLNKITFTFAHKQTHLLSGPQCWQVQRAVLATRVTAVPVTVLNR